MLVERACIVGVGLLGGSLALALKKKGIARQAVGTSRTSTTLKRALDVGVLDEAYPDAEQAVRDCDLVVLCTPIGTMAALASRIAPVLSEGTLLTDVGSTKRQVVQAIEPLQGSFRFVGGHPLAGSERTGVAYARQDLFENRTYFLTPTEGSDPAALSRLQDLVLAIGARPVMLSPEEHDHLVAITSHLPHVLACLAVALVRDESLTPEELEQALGQGFLDVTRVAAGGAEMWTDILLTNADNVDSLLQRIIHLAERTRLHLKGAARTELFQWLEDAAQFRRSLGNKDHD